MRRKTITLLLALAAVLVASAAPAMAQDRADRVEDRLENRIERFEERFDGDGFFFVDEDRFDNGFFSDDGFEPFDGLGDGVVQESEQEVESGDAEQAFDVEGGGDNSNQTLGLQAVNNTGNAVSDLGITQVGNDDAEIEVEDAGNFEISPDLSIESDQQVNQSAAASGR